MAIRTSGELTVEEWLIRCMPGDDGAAHFGCRLR